MSKLLFELRAVIEHPVIKIVDHLAAKQAALATDYYKIVPTNYLQAFLSALPELDPSYPEIPIDDVRKGDIEYFAPNWSEALQVSQKIVAREITRLEKQWGANETPC